MTQQADYTATIWLGRIISAIGWIGVAVSVLMIFILSSEFPTLYAVLAGCFYALMSLFLVASGQITRAIADLSNNSALILRRLSNDSITPGAAETTERQAEPAADTFEAKVIDGNWICVCGYKNPWNANQEVQNCAKCHRNRDFVLANYSSKSDKS